jgi:hypothetical protein
MWKEREVNEKDKHTHDPGHQQTNACPFERNDENGSSKDLIFPQRPVQSLPLFDRTSLLFTRL